MDYGDLSVLCATFSNVPVLAMTATANKSDREDIKKSLGLKNCYEIVGNPDRRNVMYEKHFRAGADIDSLMDMLSNCTRPTRRTNRLSIDNYLHSSKVVWICL